MELRELKSENILNESGKAIGLKFIVAGGSGTLMYDDTVLDFINNKPDDLVSLAIEMLPTVFKPVYEMIDWRIDNTPIDFDLFCDYVVTNITNTFKEAHLLNTVNVDLP